MINKNLKLIFLTIALVSLFLVPNFIQAGLVPCGGLRFDDDGNVIGREPACEICHIFVMLDGIIDFILIYIVFPIATMLLAFGGGMHMFSAGDPSKITEANKILFSTIIGLIIIFSSWLVINTFMTAIGLADWVGPAGGWYKIDCPI